MSHVQSHQQFIESTRLSADEINKRSRAIHESLLAESRYLVTPNFTQFHPDDLRWLFDEYDRRYLDGRCRKLLGEVDLRFRISSRMTKSGGTCTRYVWRGTTRVQYFEIAVSSTLLFETFQEDHRPIKVTGIVCQDRLEALQRIFEHELTHLVEMLVWDDSSCTGERFQSVSRRFFGHTDHRHELITPGEMAVTKLGIRPGSRVRFRMEGAEYTGLVNRITRRATVLVEDAAGQPYSDGKRYAKFYIPLTMLQPVSE